MGSVGGKAGLRGLIKVKRREKEKKEAKRKGKEGRGRGEKTHLTPVASDVPSKMAKQETRLSSEEANKVRVLNSLALTMINFPNVPTLFCSKWWELGGHTQTTLPK